MPMRWRSILPVVKIGKHAPPIRPIRYQPNIIILAAKGIVRSEDTEAPDLARSL